jgi:cytochrome c-type biogenesis protein
MAGASVSDIQGSVSPQVRRRALLASVMFSLGIMTVFVLMGAAAFSASRVFVSYMTEFRIFAALIVIVMGLHFLGLFRIGFLDRTLQFQAGDTSNMSILGGYVIGLAFAAGWTPCVGGPLTAVIFKASTESTAWEGLGLMFVFGIGLTLPFVIGAAFLGPFLRFVSRFKRHLSRVEKGMGALLIVFGVLIATDSVNHIANWMLQFWPTI